MHSQYQNTLTFRSLARYLAAKDALLILRASYIMPDSSGEQALLSDQYWALVPPPCQTAGNPGIPGESAPPPADSHMVLLKLLDRDDVLVADSVDASSHLTGHGGTETDAAADMEMQEEIERYLEDSLCSSLGCPTTYNAMVYTSNTINNMVMHMCLCNVHNLLTDSTLCNFAGSTSVSASCQQPAPAHLWYQCRRRSACASLHPPCQHHHRCRHLQEPPPRTRVRCPRLPTHGRYT